MHNYITRLNYETQTMTAMYGHIRYLTSQVNAFLRCLLFTEEAELTAPIVGDPAFVQDFIAAGPARPTGPLAARPRSPDTDVQIPMQLPHL